MTREPDPTGGADRAEESEDAELGRVLEAYLADLEAGRPDDRERLLVGHPAIARELRACLQVMNLAERMVDASGSGSRARRPVTRLDSTIMPQGQSVLTSLSSGSGPPPRVHLRDLPDEPEPVVKPRSAEMPAHNGASLGRYQLQGEIGRGGMGAILKGRDIDLGRDLALKVLLESHQANPEVVSRFIEEAQIGGQLQHPGIAPVYELGTFPEPDLRPYFAMKLVKGQTLAALLQQRTNPAQDLPRFLAIFEAICQTVAYAHARGVIHRDLKPSNVMVGSFGEVQVMDWGLAKVLPRGGIADESGVQPVQETVIMTVRSGSAGSSSESQAGSVLGTPAYMAPEQARGETERIDERADVFGLGAILCEVLTGRAPFAGSTREEIRAQAARGDLADALRRLDACAAEAELIGLARSCLAAERDGRPRNAGEVARRVTAHITGVQERLRAAELARVEAQARAAEERKQRRLTLALAASVLITASVVGGGWAYLARQRQDRATRIAIALGKVEVLRTEAERVGDDLARWRTARDSAQAVEGLLLDAPDESTRRRASDHLREVTRAAATAESDQNLLAKLIEIRSGRGDDTDGSRTDAKYEDAFREAGFDIPSLPPATVGAKIHDRPVAVRVAIASALDDWVVVRWVKRRDKDGAFRLAEVARVADPDPWRNRLREQLQSRSPERLKALQDLAKSARIGDLPAVSLHLLGRTLLDMGDSVEATVVLREAQRLFPADVWLNLILADCLERSARREEAIRYYMAARSLRPETAHGLAHALEAKGETDQAIAVFQDLARLRPKDSDSLRCLAMALTERGRTEEAEAVFNATIAACRAAIELDPDSYDAHRTLGAVIFQRGKLLEGLAELRKAQQLKPESASARVDLGRALREQGKLQEAIREFHEALRLKPDSSSAHNELGLALVEQGNFDEALAEYHEALRLMPDYPYFHSNLGIALGRLGRLEEAIAEYREALRLKTDLIAAHVNLSLALTTFGKLEEAIAECREALRLNPNCADAHNNLGNALRLQGKLDEAIAEYRTALRLKPDFPEAHSSLGAALCDQGKLDEAVIEHRIALRLKPDDAMAHYNLGHTLCDQGKLHEGIAEYRESIRLKPDLPLTHINLGNALCDQGKPDEAVIEYRIALRLKPDYPEIHTNLGAVLRDQGKLDEAIAEYRTALRLKPDYPEAHSNLGNALLDQGKLDEGIAEYHESIRLKPDDDKAHYNLGNALSVQGKLDEAIAEYRTALRLKPDYAEAHCNLGHVFRQQGHYADALAKFRRGHELGSKNQNWQYPSAEWVREAERLVELDRKLPAILAGKAKPLDAAETLGFAQLCYLKKLHRASARLCSEAFQAQPNLADDMQVQHRYNAACAAALAGAAQGKDDPPLDDAAKTRWRKQAIDWLKADLKAWSKILESGPPQVRQSILQTLQHWKADTDLAGLRDPAALAKLPEDEQKACRALWAEVDSLLAKIGSKPSP